MRILLLLLVPALGGCAVTSVASTAVDIVTLPVKVVSAGVDAATTSQAEADQKRGRELRLLEQRCRSGRARPDDDCSQVLPR
jgi:hypothetical protein